MGRSATVVRLQKFDPKKINWPNPAVSHRTRKQRGRPAGWHESASVREWGKDVLSLALDPSHSLSNSRIQHKKHTPKHKSNLTLSLFSLVSHSSTCRGNVQMPVHVSFV